VKQNLFWSKILIPNETKQIACFKFFSCGNNNKNTVTRGEAWAVY